MCGILALLFVAVPALEIYLIIEVGGAIGPLWTLGVIIATGVAGAALAKHQGFEAWRRAQRAVLEGREIGTSVVAAALVVVAAAFMMTPGFMTDAVGFALLIPPLRARAAAALVARMTSRVQTVVITGEGFDRAEGERDAEGDEHDPPPPGVIDV